VELFIIDEAGMLPAHLLGYLDEVMCKSFNPANKKKAGSLPPFGGKRIIFVGDMAQLPPVEGDPFYRVNRKGASATIHNALRAGRAARGHAIYLKHLRENVTVFRYSHRTQGVLDEIADALRNGTQTEDHQNKLEAQLRRFPQTECDKGIHFCNEAAMTSNWRTLWKKCKQNKRRLHVCKASYFENGDNTLAVDILSSLSSKAYNYAPNLLCVAAGCEVRLVKNLDVAAGLVNAAVGKVVDVVYDAADAKHLVEGKYPPPYAIIVDFSDFTGFKNETDPHPFPNHPTWVPITRQKFTVAQRDVPAAVRAMQPVKDCYRLQFPLDLATHITAHRAQGATMRDCSVFVDLGMDDPSGRTPCDAASILYVAITRATNLASLFVKPTFPKTWLQLGKSPQDEDRRKEEAIVEEKAKHFAAGNGYLELVQDEFAWRPDYSNNDKEWQDLLASDRPAQSASVPPPPLFKDEDFQAVAEGVSFAYRLKPASSERHIGIDQGTKNFSVVAVDSLPDVPPKVVCAELLEDLRLPEKRLKPEDVLFALSRDSQLLSLMQLPGHADPPSGRVDRVVVYVERMSDLNKNAKAFGIKFATLLQRLTPDPAKCVVVLSNPNLHCSGGPAFQLGPEIVATLSLKPVSTFESRSDINPAARKRNADGEPPSTYNQRKKMSADVFAYLVRADATKEAQMKLQLDDGVRNTHAARMACDPNVRLHDLGDALMHALRGLLCGGSGSSRVVPTAPSLYSNRTVAISYFPREAYWVSVLVSAVHGFLVEGMGCFNWQGDNDNPRFLTKAYSMRVKRSVSRPSEVGSRELGVALKDFGGATLFTEVDHIKVVAKQQTCHNKRRLDTRLEAGAFTNAAVGALQAICDDVMDRKQSLLVQRKDKKLGCTYLRTNRKTGKKYQVTRSMGKHTNAVLCCMSWFKENLPSFVEQRRLTLREGEKVAFFEAVRDAVKAGESRFELLQLNDRVRDFLASDCPWVTKKEHVRNFADLLLIALSKNSQHVTAVAANSRKSRPRRPDCDDDQPVGKMPRMS
jgi:hypothetical protein